MSGVFVLDFWTTDPVFHEWQPMLLTTCGRIAPVGGFMPRALAQQFARPCRACFR